MSLNITVRPRANQDLDEHFLYIARDNRDAAIRLLDAAKATFRRLAESAELGAVYPVECRELIGLRVWQIQGSGNYLIFYRPTEGSIEVVRVLHGARDVQAILDERA